MLKKETFNLEESNVAMLGSDLDKQCRLAAAQGEPAWKAAGKKPGMQIWRIEKFKVKKSQTDAGTFYKDDSYICLNTYKEKESDKLMYDVHFWLGETTSQDEAGTAAYKTVELDDFLGGAPVQHREVCGSESPMFLNYFKETGGIRLLEGGVESGFNKVKPEEYKPRLLHIKGRKNVRISQVPIEHKSLNEGDVFILDAGLNIYQWQGAKAGKAEKARAGMLCRALDDERKGKPEVHVFMQGDKDDADFWAGFPEGKCENIPKDMGDDEEWEKKSEKVVMKLSDEKGELEFTEVARGKISRSMLDSKDVFVVDVGNEIFAWVGKDASKDEKRMALHYAQMYLKKAGRPAFLPTCRILEGAENNVFKTSFDS